MNAARAATLAAGITLNVSWLVSICVRGSFGAPDLNPQLAIGALPPSPLRLPPLIIPRRDPFVADNLGRTASLTDAAALAPAAKRDLASANIPDVAAFAAGGNNVGVVATIVGRDESYALVEDGRDVHVARIGDAFGGSSIAEIAIDHVRLANGRRIAMSTHGSSAPIAPLVVMPVSTPSPITSADHAAAPAAPTPELTSNQQPRGASGVALPAGTVRLGQPLIGAPSVVAPNGGLMPNLGGSVFPTTQPAPFIMPLRGSLPGGQP